MIFSFNLRLLIFQAFLVVGLLSCQSETQPLPASGYEYFPLEVGQYIQYTVEETRFALAQPTVSRTFQRRETITDTYTDASGQTVYTIERAVLQANGDWKVDSTLMAWRTPDRALRMENGVTEVKLSFPLSERHRWNGNLYNQQQERLFEATRVAKPLSLGQQNFDSTVTVVQQNDSSLVVLRRLREVYAQGVGLVQRERTFLYYCSTSACAGQGNIEYGMKQLSTVSSYGIR